jgi:hypothetical protein
VQEQHTSLELNLILENADAHGDSWGLVSRKGGLSD